MTCVGNLFMRNCKKCVVYVCMDAFIRTCVIYPIYIYVQFVHCMNACVLLKVPASNRV